MNMIGGLSTISYTAGNPATTLGGAATFSDASNFDGGALTVTDSDATSTTQLAGKNVGNGAGQPQVAVDRNDALAIPRRVAAVAKSDRFPRNSV